MASSATIVELCQVENDDGLHEFGGGHGNKGNDFARFWLISELITLTEVGTNDYLFILEYVQDVARIDDPAAPAAITLYQLKKKEGSVWDLNSLAGLTEKGKQVKPASPLAKIVKSVLGFKMLSASAEFVSNARFNVKLAAGGTALQMDYLSLADLQVERQSNFRDSAATAHSVPAAAIPLQKIGLRYAPIEVNDMRVHVIGVAHGFLKKLSIAHAAQADSFVDALFAKLATASRNTSKCQTWEELVSKRGYSKKQFNDALAALQLLPDQQGRRETLLKELASALEWHTRDRMRIEVALTELARLKVTGGELSIANVDWAALRAVSATAEAESWSTVKEFEAAESCLKGFLPDETVARIRALAIYGMVQAWTSQTFA
ncbi:DUF4297 domain-containing protein [Burkholderia sp. IDO3]|uniref:DUF4297 domain-containing protein n=1 Tax=Burkholderia sp. IDO3 TaxID=1705310 RepID=UPI000BBACD84|nr:DUF4297 domain-containing protein [Burkholderia sp. IDO3]AXK64750.1 DUF4297 domain-containing protein [Burkholderia sp. IDO3]PCD61310.1 hypothetical protein CN645_13355 [Burkholderia sp. IDO3]